MDPDKLCQTMFYTGLFLNIDRAKENANLCSALEQVDSITEHEFVDSDGKFRELSNFFNGFPVLQGQKDDLELVKELEKQVQELQGQLAKRESKFQEPK